MTDIPTADDVIEQAQKDYDALKVERDRYRVALEEIEERTRPESDMADFAVNKRARRALEGESDE